MHVVLPLRVDLSFGAENRGGALEVRLPHTLPPFLALL